MSEKQAGSSKLFVAAIGVFVILFVGAWLAVYYFEAPDYDPEVAQEYVQHFNRRCLRDLQDTQACRDIVGHHHRACFEEHLDRDLPKTEPQATIYNRDRYMECMWRARDK